MSDCDLALSNYFEAVRLSGHAENRLASIVSQAKRRTQSSSTALGACIGPALVLMMVLQGSSQPVSASLPDRKFVAFQIELAPFDARTKRALVQLLGHLP